VEETDAEAEAESAGGYEKGNGGFQLTLLRNFDIVVNHVPETRPKYMW
jgi:hypothetical protein